MSNIRNQIRVTNIQRMCLHDGPGIRTTIFLKGCCIKCPWCSNPENISFEIEKYNLNGNEGIYGKDYSVDQLYDETIKDRLFWDKKGGITFSGGEPLMQAEDLLEFIKKIRSEGINTAIETSLFAPIKYTKCLADIIDYFIVDIKILVPQKCAEIIGGDISIYLKNVDFLYNKRKIKLFRIPLNYEYTFLEDNKKLIKSFLMKYRGVPVQMFSVHNLGASKYFSLNKKIWKAKELSEQEIKDFCEELKKDGIMSEIIKI